MAELSEKDMKVVKKHGVVKMVREFTKTYNKLCPDCKVICMQNPRDIYNNCCKVCKPKLDRIAEKFK